jgi:hypothetical protein
MSYIRIRSEGDGPVGLGCGCGPACGCAGCRKTYSLGEWYVPPDDDEDEEPEKEPPKKTPPPSASSGESDLFGYGNFAGLHGAGIGCGCSARGGSSHLGANAQLGDFGWSVKTPISAEGHEVLTRMAVGPSRTIAFQVTGIPKSRVLTSAELDEIIAGNVSVDLGFKYTGVVFSLNKDEQKRHSLRREYGQPLPAALADVIGSLRAQHAGILAEGDPKKRLRRIGQALHLVQDSFSPAHTDRRSGSGWCISYIKNFGRGSYPVEHGKPSDDRDKIANPASRASAAAATAASRVYLAIVFKAIYGHTAPDPVAVSESAAEFGRFVANNLRSC